MDFSFTELKGSKAEYINIPVKVPGSVQKALKDAGLIPDWNTGTNYVQTEWIENRHWIYTTRIPDEWIAKGKLSILHCMGLDDKGEKIVDETVTARELGKGKTWDNLKIRRWWPNGSGDQPLYKLVCTLLDANGNFCQAIEKTLGFKNTEWLPCKDALPEADPWICSINGTPVFLQGVNWTPIRPDFQKEKTFYCSFCSSVQQAF